MAKLYLFNECELFKKSRTFEIMIAESNSTKGASKQKAHVRQLISIRKNADVGIFV